MMHACSIAYQGHHSALLNLVSYLTNTVETHLTTTILMRPPYLKTTFGSERNFSLYFMFDFASLIRPVS